ncbi:Phosphatidylserine decarboxylase proenzyme 3 [Nymphaea thermarum]|nr:Phosphatidylserine decarboxylase proenzyme 3 [Nymphaea thermarum]
MLTMKKTTCPTLEDPNAFVIAFREYVEKQRRTYSPESAKAMSKFIEFFDDQINSDKIRCGVDHFKTLNELKPRARRIVEEDNDSIAVAILLLTEITPKSIAVHNATDVARFVVRFF